MTFPAVSDVSEFPPLVSLSAKVAAAYLSSRQDVPIERVGDLIEGVYRSLVRIAVVEDTAAPAPCAAPSRLPSPPVLLSNCGRRS